MRSLSARSFKVRHGMRADIEKVLERGGGRCTYGRAMLACVKKKKFSRRVCRELKGSDKAETNRDGIYMASSVRGIPVVSSNHHPLWMCGHTKMKEES